MLGVQPHMITAPLLRAPLLPQESWEERIESIPGVLRYDAATLPYLSKTLRRFAGEDNYLTCAGYHAFTGRNGLWAYARGRSMVLFARNPAQTDQIIFFPQMGEAFPHLALTLMEMVPPPPGGYRIARVPAEQADFMAAVLNRKSRRFTFTAETETILDWTYPVHTIDTAEVVEAAGRRFKSFRQHLNTIDAARIIIAPLDPRSDVPELMGVIGPWAESKADICPPAEMVDVYVSFLRVMRMTVLGIRGIKYYMDGELVAFDAWAMPGPGSRTANSFAGFSKTKIRGFSEFQHHTFCRLMLADGVERACLGGSEAEGLDHFKRKMNPVHSLDLKSIAVKTRR
jgi:hypothetical protein